MTGVDLQTENVAHIIQLALGPVFLLSGVGITLSLLTQRLSRIVDRARTLEDRREATSNEAKLKQIDRDLRVILRRSRYINSAIALCTTSALLTALVVTLLFASAFTPMSVGAVITDVRRVDGQPVAGLPLFLIEVRIAIKSLRIGEHRNSAPFSGTALLPDSPAWRRPSARVIARRRPPPRRSWNRHSLRTGAARIRRTPCIWICRPAG
jgi:hypothetical protein